MTDHTEQPSLAPVIIVIFGITGDLAGRKLLPALYHLFKDGLLHPDSVVLGISRREVSADELLEQVEVCINEVDNVCDPEGFATFKHALQMHTMDLDNGSDYDELLTRMNQIEAEQGDCMTRLYYLSIPPKTMQPIVKLLGEHGHSRSCPHDNAEARLLVEKPFGYDLASARELIEETGRWFNEDQLYRIDHYVAKETVQNILAFRRHNPIFETLWNQNYIESIDITAFEQITIEGRAAFYEGVGALRDFIQSHLLQLLTVVTMELPADSSSDAVHAAKLKLLQQISTIEPSRVTDCAVRGQYEGYKDEVQNPDSRTETYAELRITLDTARWHDIPIIVRTGKAMAKKMTAVTIKFRPAENSTAAESTPNVLTFEVQPSEKVSVRLNAKRPGFDDQLQAVDMDFSYESSFNETGHPDAYERVLVDAARGDHTLFTTSQEVLEAWRIVENVIQTWSESDNGMITYPQGAQSVETS